MQHFRCSWARGLILALVVSIGGASAGFAQVCPQPDGLDAGPCCGPAQLNLPQFPPISHPMRYICWDNCNVQVNANICVDIAAPVPVQSGGAIVCGVYTIRYTIKTCNPANPTILWTGLMRAHYARTWGEATGAAPDTQVWRFLLNGDLIPSAFLIQNFPNQTCVLAPCRAAFGNRIHAAGYIDYAFDCVNGRFQAAWALDHGCDAFNHAPGVSARPGAFHPTRSYTWLGPGTGFVPNSANLPPSVGQITGSVRPNRWSTPPFPAICVFREPAGGSLDTTGAPSCPCAGAAGGPPQYVRTFTAGQGACGSSWALAPNGAIPFVQKRIGSWTNGAIFPGIEDLLLDEGHLQWIDGCQPGLVTTQYFEGVETRGGFPAFTVATPPAPLGRQFEDWASANRGPNNPAPFIGTPYISFYIISVNAP